MDLRAEAVKRRGKEEDGIIQLVQRGDKIGAVRLTRELYGFDLTRAKQFVEQLDGSDPSR